MKKFETRLRQSLSIFEGSRMLSARLRHFARGKSGNMLKIETGGNRLELVEKVGTSETQR